MDYAAARHEARAAREALHRIQLQRHYSDETALHAAMVRQAEAEDELDRLDAEAESAAKTPPPLPTLTNEQVAEVLRLPDAPPVSPPEASALMEAIRVQRLVERWLLDVFGRYLDRRASAARAEAQGKSLAEVRRIIQALWADPDWEYAHRCVRCGELRLAGEPAWVRRALAGELDAVPPHLR